MDADVLSVPDLDAGAVVVAERRSLLTRWGLSNHLEDLAKAGVLWAVCHPEVADLLRESQGDGAHLADGLEHHAAASLSYYLSLWPSMLPAEQWEFVDFQPLARALMTAAAILSRPC